MGFNRTPNTSDAAYERSMYYSEKAREHGADILIEMRKGAKDGRYCQCGKDNNDDGIQHAETCRVAEMER